MKISVKSKLIKSIYYQPDTMSLDVNFQDGHTTVYYEVPQSVTDTLVEASSPGWYYLRHIKGSFPSQ